MIKGNNDNNGNKGSHNHKKKTGSRGNHNTYNKVF